MDTSQPIPSTVKEALDHELRYYFDGGACSKGHTTIRRIVFTKGRIETRCDACLKISLEKQKQKDDFKKKRSKTSRGWRERNPDYGKLWKRDKLSERPFYGIISSIRSRCIRNSIPFDLDEDYLASILPEGNRCPILGIEMNRAKGSGGAYLSVDRIIPELGYVKGNVAIISAKANAIKQDCTDPAIFRRLADWIEAHQR